MTRQAARDLYGQLVECNANSLNNFSAFTKYFITAKYCHLNRTLVSQCNKQIVISVPKIGANLKSKVLSTEQEFKVRINKLPGQHKIEIEFTPLCKSMLNVELKLLKFHFQAVSKSKEYSEFTKLK